MIQINFIHISLGLVWILGLCWYMSDQRVALDPVREVMISKEFQSLVQKCAPLYDVGLSDEWSDCMGVGKK
jgi:hypothetical protein